MSELRNEIPGWEGSVGPFPMQYGKPHVGRPRMPDKPCTHCGGSGSEPDPVMDAYRAFAGKLTSLGLPIRDKDELARRFSTYHAVRQDQADQHEARIVFLEAALRDALDFFPGASAGPSDATTSRLVPWGRLYGWRDILANNPGQLNADGSCKRHDFQPAPDDPELGDRGIHHCTRCGSRWLPGTR